MKLLLQEPETRVPSASSAQPARRVTGPGSHAAAALGYCVAGAVLVWGCVDGRFRDHEGFLTGAACFPIAIGAALAALLWLGIATEAALWLALAAVGQAAALQLIDAGPLIHYERYRLAFPTTAVGRLALATILVQTIAVCIAVARRRHQVASLFAAVGPVRAVLSIGFASLCAAAVSPRVSAYAVELLLAAAIQFVNVATFVLFATTLPADVIDRFRRRLATWTGAATRAETTDAPAAQPSFVRVLAFAAVWTTTLAALLSVVSYQRHPHVQDEVVYLHQARMLAAGQLTIPAPPVARAFDFYLMETKDGRWFATPPVGWPAVLALGVLAGVPWLVNPILGGVGVVLTGLVVRELYDRRVATLVVLLLCVSPWFNFINMSYMTHSLTLVCALLAAFGLLRAGGTNATAWAVAGGAALGFLSLIRPLEGMILGVLLALRGLGLGGARLRLPPLLAYGCATILVGSIVFPYNHYFTGKPTKFPINVYLDREFGPNVNALGFGAGRGMGWGLDAYPGHSPLEAAINTNLNLFSLNRELSGWATGSIFLLAFAALVLRATSDRLMLVTIAAVVGVHACYWYSGGPDFGARYWYLIIIPCLVLVVRAIDAGAEMVRRAVDTADAPTRAWLATLTLAALTLVNFVPWRAIDKYHHYLNMRPDVPALAAAHGMHNALVLIRGKEHPDYTSAATHNPLDWNPASPANLYAFDRSPESTAAVLAAYPGRPVWYVNGPSITGRGYEVVAGPEKR